MMGEYGVALVITALQTLLLEHRRPVALCPVSRPAGRCHQRAQGGRHTAGHQRNDVRGLCWTREEAVGGAPPTYASPPRV